MVLDRAARGPGPRTHTARSQEGPASRGPPTTHRVTTPASCPMRGHTATAPPLGGLLQVGPQLAHFNLQAGTVPGRLIQHPAGVGQLRLVQCLDAAHLWGQRAEVKPSSPPTQCHSPAWAPPAGPPCSLPRSPAPIRSHLSAGHTLRSPCSTPRGPELCTYLKVSGTKRTGRCLFPPKDGHHRDHSKCQEDGEKLAPPCMAGGVGAAIMEDRLAVPQMDQQQSPTQQCHPHRPLASTWEK